MDVRCITKHLSEIMRTNDAVVDETHGILRVPESLRIVSSSGKGLRIVQAENSGNNSVNDGTLIHGIGDCETNFVSHWSGDPVKFQHITTMWWVV